MPDISIDNYPPSDSVSYSPQSFNTGDQPALVEEIPASEEENTSAAEKEDQRPERTFAGAAAEAVTFSYQGEEMILSDYSICFEPGKITGIHGASGSGKSTLLKLLMRFWNVDKGKIIVDNWDV